MIQISKVNLREIVPEFQTDIPRIRTGRLASQFWSVFVPCSSQYKDAVRASLEQVDVIYRFVNQYSDQFQMAYSSSDITNCFNNNKIGSLLGLEGGHSIDSSIATLRMFYSLGVRYMTLTHNCSTPWANCSNDILPPGAEGLTSFGKQIVFEMNRLGMIVDLSHVSNATMQTVLDITLAPVIFSHSSVYALCNNTRNVPNNVLLRLPKNGGIIMINFYNYFLTCTQNASTLDVVNHIDYVKNLIGVDYVGIGSDFDGIDYVPTGLEDTSKFPNLVAELVKKGYSINDISKIIGGNLIRVFKQVEDTAYSLRQNKPSELILQNIENQCRTNN